MTSVNLEQLTIMRREHIQSLKKNKNHSHEMIAGLYSDPSHFIYELLQNADDAFALTVSFKLTKDQLEVSHDGKRVFDYEDIEAITTIGSSTKTESINSIGRFGAGFKSVFIITKSPRIHSGKYHFKIIDYLIPENIEPIKCEEKTVIILPFNNDFLSKEEIYRRICEKLITLSSESLLFLNNIGEIKWETEKGAGYYLCKKQSEESYTSILSKIYEEENLQQYLVFSKELVNISSRPLKIIIAYLIKENQIIATKQSNLFVFFPTEVRTDFKFLVHVPYKTVPNRETIQFDDRENQQLTSQLTELIAESVVKVKELGFLNVNFLSLLPINADVNHQVYKAAFDRLKTLFIQTDLWPTTTSSFSNYQNSLLASPKDLTELLNSDDISLLFSKKNWLDTSITPSKDSTKDLWNYIKNILNVREITMNIFVNSITEYFILRKTDEWLIKFYEIVKNYTSLYPILSRKPIIRLENGRHKSPKNEQGDLEVYLPSEQKYNFPTLTVKKNIINDEKIKFFLMQLGLREADIFDEIKNFIVSKYKEEPNISKEEYLKDFEICFSIWNNSNEENKQKVIDLLKNIYFIACIDANNSFCFKKGENKNKNPQWSSSIAIYFKTEKLSLWFHGNTETKFFFVDKELEDKQYKIFLEKMGVNNSLFIENSEELYISSHGSHKQGVDGFNPYFNLHGLEHALKNITLSRSIFIWSILLENSTLNKFQGHTISSKNRKKWTTNKKQLSTLMKLIGEKYWLFDKEGILLDTVLTEISVNDLHQEYNKIHSNFGKLVNLLGLKFDEKSENEKEKQLDEERKRADRAEKEIERLKKEKDEAEKRANEKERENERLKNELKQLTNPQTEIIEESEPLLDFDELTITIDTSPLKSVETKDLSGQPLNERNFSNKTYNLANSSKSKSAKKTSTINENKTIGDLGEKYAEIWLNDQYQSEEFSIINWNLHGNGEGYDFKILKNGQEIAYYEIKSKIDEKPTSFLISRSQWSFAKNLYQQDQGNKYIVLLVSNVGTQNIIIKEICNPVQEWENGNLEAQPVEIVL